jgi:hypothetical protein
LSRGERKRKRKRPGAGRENASYFAARKKQYTKRIKLQKKM